MRRGPAVFILLMLLGAAALGAYQALSWGWGQLSSYSPQYHSVPRPVAGPPALSQRLVLVMVDGLQTEEARLLPSVDWLQRQGSWYRLTVPEPSHRDATLATVLSGAAPTLHGVLIPGMERPVGTDHILAAAQRMRVTTGAVAGTDLEPMLQPAVGVWAVAPETESLLQHAQEMLSAGGPKLVVLHISSTNQQISNHRLDDSDYQQALAQLDALLAQLLERIDLNQDAVMVAGTSPKVEKGLGLNGGSVPLVMAGAGIRQGHYGQGSLTDVASTAAALLGLPTPLENQGRPLLEALNADGRPADLIAQHTLKARKSLADAVLSAAGSVEAAPEPPKSAVDAPAYQEALEQQLKDAQFAVWKTELMRRLPYAAVGLSLILIYLLVLYRQPFGGPALLGGLTYVTAFHALFFAFGGRYSMAWTGLDTMGTRIGYRLSLEVAIAMAIAMLLTGASLARKGFRKGPYLTVASLHTALGIVALITLPVIAALGLIGWQFPIELPSPGLLAWFFITGLQVLVIGALALLWALLGVTATRVFQRLRPATQSASDTPSNVVEFKPPGRPSKHRSPRANR